MIEINQAIIDKSLEHVHGIYAIVNVKNSRGYVGSAVNLLNRFREHIRDLRRGTHCNRYVQSAWNKYGEECFVILVLEEVEDRSILLDREDYYLKTVSNLYNFRLTASKPPGPELQSFQTRQKASKSISRALTGRVLSEEHRRRISEAAKGRKNSVESNERRRKSMLGKNTRQERLRRQALL